ncbi:MAG: hypothetical protein U9N62_11925 [Thermotogota bacterium]|nr:hypothetical protein [Thermotogota bacterium]
MKKSKRRVIIIILILLTSVIFGLRTSDPEKILSNYSEDQIREIFTENRMFEWIDKFDVEDDGIYILTGKWYYQVQMEEDKGLFFSGYQSRYDYDRNQVSWLLISVFIISGGIILLIILTSVKWHGFNWYKKIKKIQ